MQTLEARLEQMSLKEFRQFQHQLEQFAEGKVSRYFRKLFKGYIMQMGLPKTETEESITAYLEQCNFPDRTIFSRMLSLEDPLHDFTLRYDTVSVSPTDIFASFRMSGDPDNPKIELPRDWHAIKMGSGEEPKYYEFPPFAKSLALILWRCYRAYIDSKPDDDRDFSSEEEAEQEEWDEFGSKLKTKFGDDNDDDDPNSEYAKMRADAEREAQNEAESYRIEREAAMAKCDNEHTRFMQNIRERTLKAQERQKDFAEKKWNN